MPACSNAPKTSEASANCDPSPDVPWPGCLLPVHEASATAMAGATSNVVMTLRIGTAPFRGGSAPPARPRRAGPAGRTLLAGAGRGLGGIGQVDLGLGDGPGHGGCRGVLLGAGPPPELEEHGGLELLDRVDHGPPFVPPDGPRGRDPARGEHVDPKRGIADPALPHGLSDLLFHACSRRIERGQWPHLRMQWTRVRKRAENRSPGTR